jgi:exoribonuclease-2
MLEHDALVERIGLADEASFAIRKAERFSNQHWKMLYLQKNEEWQGEAIVVMLHERNTSVIMPTLALEPRVRTKGEIALDQSLTLQVTSVNVADLRANFRVV